MIKSKLVTRTLNEDKKEIDWNKQQLLECTIEGFYTIVITTGKHDKENFSAIPLYSSYIHNIKDGFCADWKKSAFHLPTSPITITFEND